MIGPGCRRGWVAVVATVVVTFPTIARPAAPWSGHEKELEDTLRTGEVVSQTKIGMGITQPMRVTIRKNGEVIQAVWKPLLPGRRGGYWESYKSEVAAYELDKLLELGMVPPTVTREISGQRGSVQFWVDGAKLYRDVEGNTPTSAEWSHELSNMKLFDNLISNPDRNARNFMADSAWNIVLIDHSRAFTTSKKLLPEDHQRPVQFDRRVIERLRTIDGETLERHLGSLLMKSQKKALRARVRALLDYLDRLVEERGVGRVLF